MAKPGIVLLKPLFLFLFFELISAGVPIIPCQIENKGDTLISTCPSLHDCIDGYCFHKELFPLTGREIFGSILLMLLGGLTNAGGLGGGALLSPILLLIFNYSPNKAIMIVYGIVFGGSVGNFLNVALQRNPKTGKSYVDYDLSLICMPQMVLGAMVGVLLNHIIAPILIIVGLIAIIIYTGRNVYSKAKVQYAAESNQMSFKQLDTKENLTPLKKEYELSVMDASKGSFQDKDYDPKLKKILDEDNQLFPKAKILLIASMLLFVIFTFILKGSKEFSSPLNIEYCGGIYWIFFLISLVGCAGFYFKNVEFVNQRLKIKKECGYVPEEGEFILTESITQKLGILSLVAGILAGLLGLGGGMVMNPVLLELGVETQILAATLGFFVVQTSFVTLFQAFFSGDVTLTEIIFFVGISLVGSYGISWVLNYFVKKYKRPSIILFAISFVLLLSFIVMPLFGLYKSIDQPEQMFIFHSVC